MNRASTTRSPGTLSTSQQRPPLTSHPPLARWDSRWRCCNAGSHRACSPPGGVSNGCATGGRRSSTTRTSSRSSRSRRRCLTTLTSFPTRSSKRSSTTWRLAFLDELDGLFANVDTLEAQVHQAIERNLWVLGSEFTLISSNKTLRTLVRDWVEREFVGER